MFTIWSRKEGETDVKEGGPITMAITGEMKLTADCFQLRGRPHGYLFPSLCSRASLPQESMCTGGGGIRKLVLNLNQ